MCSTHWSLMTKEQAYIMQVAKLFQMRLKKILWMFAMMRLHKITSKIQTSLETYCIYECSKISLYGTQYKCGQYIILPESNNSIFHFGKIIKLLACEKYCYLLYQETSNQYCQKTDLQSCAFEIERPGDQVHVFCCHF